MTAPHSTERAAAIVDVHILLADRSGRLLLGLRQNTGFADGCWHLPAGHLEDEETLTEAVVREAREELGVAVDQAATEFVHLMHEPGRVATFFLVRRWRGTPTNMEPTKCAALEWFALDGGLPEPMVPYCHDALHSIVTGQSFSQYGWRRPGSSERAA